MVKAVVVEILGGGLGNLLFMHHVGYALSTKWGCPFYIQSEYTDCNNRPNMKGAYSTLFRHARFISPGQVGSLGRVRMIRERGMPFEEIAAVEGNEVIVLYGYFQSYKYALGYWSQIRDVMWSNVAADWSAMRLKHQQLHGENKTVCVHVRRGDYLNLQDYHPVASEAFYQQSFANVLGICPEAKMVVFSDDMPFVEAWPLLEPFRGRIHFEREPNPVLCLMLMSQCNHFIVANSSLSVNAYLLRSDKDKEAVVCAPKIWFGPRGPAFKYEDFLPAVFY